LDVFVALSTVAVGFFAGVELWAQRTDRQARQAAADARVSAEAFPLRRTLRSWLASENRGEPFAWSAEITLHLDRAEARIQAMAAEAAGASPNVQEMLREATARFYRGTGTLNDTLMGPETRSRHDVILDIMWEWPPADDDLEACAELLTRLIDSRLENTHNRLAALWNQEKPLKQLGRRIPTPPY
jgi:hypothetical protein